MVAAGFTSTVLAQPGTTWNSWFEDYEEPHISIAGIVQGAKGEDSIFGFVPRGF